ncbi:hypothetical protein HDU67_004388 [Dinochytrium kinnereticum]|nr:hypothetical protein HDU67_004388 [Dinochytrium kinnereticum]
MKITAVIAIAAALLAPPLTAAGAPPQIICNDGYVDGKICLSDCKSPGVYIPKLGNLISSISLPSFSLDFDATTPTHALATSKNVQVALGIPTWLGFLGTNFVGAGAVIGVGSVGAKTAGTLVSPDYGAASGTVSEGTVSLDIVNAKLSIDDPAVFGEFLKTTLQTSGPAPVRLKGYANNKADLIKDPFNSFTCLRYVGFDLTSSSLSGLGGLKKTVISALPVIKSGVPGEGIKLQIPLTIENPSNIVLNIKNSDVTLDLLFEGQTVGTVVLPALKLASGVNKVDATAFVNPKSLPAGLATRKLFSQFTGGVASNVMVANGRASGLKVLDAALGSLSIPQVLPAQQEKLILNAQADGNTLEFIDDSGFIITMKSTITAFNPFDVPVTITNIKADLNYKSTTCVQTNSPITTPFTIPPKSSLTSPTFPIIINTTNPICDEFVSAQLQGSTSLLDVKSVLAIAVDRFGSEIEYEQGDVSVTTVF